jgi:hypothetical protein
LGFKWKEKWNKKVLNESHGMQEKRYSYLRSNNQLRKEGRNIVYDDESYILSSRVMNKS